MLKSMAKISGRSAQVKYVWGNTEFLLMIAGEVFLAVRQHMFHCNLELHLIYLYLFEMPPQTALKMSIFLSTSIQ